MFRKLVAAVAVAATAFTSAAHADNHGEMKTINFGIISTESTVNLKKTWNPFLEAMEKATGLKVKAFFASDYAGVIEGMRFNKVHVAWFGNKSAMEAVDRSKGEIFAQTVDADGNPGYWSLIITHKDSPLNSLDDVLKCDGKLNFGIGDPNSTSGYLVPSVYVFGDRGIDPKKCFKTMRHAGHEANAMATANKLVDAAANNTENMRRLQLTAPKAYANIKVLWKSPLIPSDPIVWRKDLSDGLKAKVKGFFMDYGRKGTEAELADAKKVLGGLQWAPFRESTNAQLDPIRVLSASKKINKIKADKKLSDADKKAKIAELEKVVAKYKK